MKPVERDGNAAFEMQSELELKAAGITTKGPATLLITPAARPLSFRRELETAGQKYTIECTFGAGQVSEKISGAKDLTQEIKVPAGVYCFDNNLLSSLAMICSQLPLEVGKDVEVRTFHPSSLQVIPLTFKRRGLARIRLGDHELECFECEVLPIKNTFWITRDGRFVQAQQANLVIELIDTRE